MDRTSSVKVKTDPDTGEAFLDLADFKDFVDITKVKSYTLEELDDDDVKCLILKFYNAKGKLVKAKKQKVKK